MNLLSFIGFASLLFTAASAGAHGSSATISRPTPGFKPARPPAIPLAVKSPYLSTWLPVNPNGNNGRLPGSWPVSWTGQIVTGWAGLIRVDGRVFQWMGAVPGVENARQTAFEYTSTKSIFHLDVGGKVAMVVTFLSPVTPKDLKLQSLVFSYLNVEVRSADEEEHHVELYSDISAEWAAGQRDAEMRWNSSSVNNVAYHAVWKHDQVEFAEGGPGWNELANWGTIFYGTNASPGLTTQTGSDRAVRGAFISSGRLDNTKDTRWRSVENDWPVFAFARNMGSVGRPKSVLFSIGLTQRNAIQFLGNGDIIQKLPSLWTHYWRTGSDALEYFHNHYSRTNEACTALDVDVQIRSEKAAGPDYAAITALVVRQTFGTLQLVGTESKPYLFMKEISSGGMAQTVDVVYPMHPILLDLNAHLLKLMLDPLFENQEAGHYPLPEAMHDSGWHYPNATGHTVIGTTNVEHMPLEESGNMIIMTLAYAQRTRDYAYLRKNYRMLKQWTEFMVHDQTALLPGEQLSTDDFAGVLHNQTNLALKGIIGIKAMSKISELVNQTRDASRYGAVANDWIRKWMALGISNDGGQRHATLLYGASQTHGLLYNVYCDLELGLDFVPDDVYAIQDAWYRKLLNDPRKAQLRPYGLPLDTRHTRTKADWLLFTAASSAKDVRDLIVKDVLAFINETPDAMPFPDLYNTIYANTSFAARPVMGAAFALLVKQRA